MTPLKILFSLTWALLWNDAETDSLTKTTAVHQERGFLSADVGGNLTLICLYDSNARYYWYKQTLGLKLQLISISNKFDKSGTFYSEYKNNLRFKLETDTGKSQLKISDLQVSDTGTYFCASGLSFLFEFGEGTTVSVKHPGVKNKTLLYQSASGTIHPGGSVILECSVQTESWDEEHRVYWFRSLEESHLELFYGGRKNQCERNLHTQAHTCVYNLPINNVKVSHSGTYYCAVASSGHVLFGKGTKLELKSGVASLLVVYFLSGALILTIILSVFLAFILYKMHKRYSCQTSELKVKFSACPTTNREIYQDPDSLQYAAININLPRRSRCQGKNRK